MDKKHKLIHQEAMETSEAGPSNSDPRPSGGASLQNTSLHDSGWTKSTSVIPNKFTCIHIYKYAAKKIQQTLLP